MKTRICLPLMFLGTAVLLIGLPQSEAAQAPAARIGNSRLDEARVAAIRQLLRQQALSAKAEDLHKLAPAGQVMAPFRSLPVQTHAKPVSKPKSLPGGTNPR